MDQATMRGVKWDHFHRAIVVNRLNIKMSDLAFKVMANEVMRAWR